MSGPILSVRGLSVHYPVPARSAFGRPQTLRAVTDVSLDVAAGESLGVVGETGCGKTSLGRAILGLVKPADGDIVFEGQKTADLDVQSMRALRSRMQVVFQDPLSSLNPRMTVGEIVAEPLALHRPQMTGGEIRLQTARMIERVGLTDNQLERYPAELSGGQCQRVSIARAMILDPRLIVCDEPVSALDVSIQAQICNLLRALQSDSGTAMIFISHDLSVVRYMCQNIAVMYLGRVVEYGSREALFRNPRHPYTRALIDAVPIPDPDTADLASLSRLGGEIPSPLAPPSGCVFRTRCPIAADECGQQVPRLRMAADGSRFACLKSVADATEG